MNAMPTCTPYALCARALRHALLPLLIALTGAACDAQPAEDHLVHDPFAVQTAVVVPILPTPAPIGSAAFTVWGEEPLDAPDIADFALQNGGQVVWMATRQGLERFDAITLARRRMTQRDGLPSNYISAVHVDDQGTVWLGSENAGMARLDPSDEAIVVENGAQGMAGASVTDIASDGRGGLWVSGSESVWHRHARGGWRAFQPAVATDADDADLPQMRIRRLAVDPDGSARFVVDAVAHRIALSGEMSTVPIDVDGVEFEQAGPAAVRVMPDGQMWFAYMGSWEWPDRTSGVFRIDREGAVTLVSDEQGLFSAAFDTVPTAGDEVIVLTDYGVFRLQGEEWSSLAMDEEEAILETNEGVSAQLATDGSVWASLGYPLRERRESASGKPLARRDPGGEWSFEDVVSGTPEAGLGIARSLLDRNPLALSLRFTRLPYVDSPFDEALDAAAGPDGTRWYAIGRGRLLQERPDGTWNAHTLAPIPPKRATMMEAAPDESVWLAEECGALFNRGNDGTWSAFDVADGLPGIGIATLAVDDEGGVWVGSSSECLAALRPADANARPTTSREDRHPIGAFRSPTGTWTYFHDDASWMARYTNGYPSSALAVNTKRDVFGRSDTTAWFAVQQVLLRRTPNGVWSWFDGNNGLEVLNGADTLTIDANGNAWLPVDGGVARLDGNGIVTVYGITGPALVHDIAAAPDGSMWFTNAWPSGRATSYPVGGVLRRLPDGTWLRYGTEHGLPDDKALEIEVDADGVVWVKTFAEGLARFEPGE